MHTLQRLFQHPAEKQGLRVTRYCLCCFACLCFFTLMHEGKAATVQQSRGIKGLIRQEHATVAAGVAAEIVAWREGEKALAAHPDLQFISQKAGGSPLHLPNLKGLAVRLMTLFISGRGMGGFPPDLQVVLEVDWRFVEPFRPQLLNALKDSEYTQLYAFAALRLEALLAAYDAAAAAIPPLPPNAPGGGERLLPLQQKVKAMQGTKRYMSLLPQLQSTWHEPEKTLAGMLEARALDPDNPLIMVAEAEMQIQLDKPAKAQILASEAARLLPEFARAHDVLGAALLRQRLPALAVTAFSQAISLAPEYASYYLHRAAANLVQEEIAAMCEDFFTACVLNECEGLEWARQSGKCAR